MMNRFTCALILLFSVSFAFSANRALVVGIGNYNTRETGWCRIHGDEDVDMISLALQKQGMAKEDILTLKNSDATKKNIVMQLKNLANISQKGDNVFFVFSGHGQLIKNFNNDKENNDVDESIVPYDAYKTGRYKHNGEMYGGQNHLLDDEMMPLFNAIKTKIGTKGILFVAIDACYSQGMEQDVSSPFTAEDITIMGPSRGTADVFKPQSESYLKSITRPTEYSKGAKMIVVSACKFNERNFEYKIPNTNKIVGSLCNCIALLLNDGVNFKRWIKYFENKEYKGKKLFISAQHPTITVYD